MRREGFLIVQEGEDSLGAVPLPELIWLTIVDVRQVLAFLEIEGRSLKHKQLSLQESDSTEA